MSGAAEMNDTSGRQKGKKQEAEEEIFLSQKEANRESRIEKYKKRSKL